MTRQQHMKLGLVLNANSLDGPAPARSSGLLDFAYFSQLAREAEQAKLHFVTLTDHAASANGWMEPISLLSGISALTSHLGLGLTINATTTEPYNVARFFASLELISGGRAAWNFTTSFCNDGRLSFSPLHIPSLDLWSAMAEEHLSVVQGLWDTWEDDTMIQNKETGQFLDPAKLHFLNHVGQFYRVKGPLNLCRSPQGQPVIFMADPAEAGRDVVARRADCVFMRCSTVEEMHNRADAIRRDAVQAGRTDSALNILVDVAQLSNHLESRASERAADLLQNWFEAGAADGFLVSDSGNGEFSVFAHTVVPLLQQRGLFRREYAGITLRDNLGLPKPKSRLAAA
jgi:alkanesulfonate monooxygenase SsuD/methylene tetrahydromethanopterin reductase-like flavin-dependent oxidoreductase (luciferase family)